MENIHSLKNNSPIKTFYKGKSIFLTGATGFLGAVLLEKILYSCPDIKKIYALIKPAKGLSSRERLDKLFETELFQRIKGRNPEAFDKVIPITGNLVHQDLELSPNDVEMLQREVSIVFHGAASVNFNLPIREAIEINTLATLKMLKLARTMNNLEVFVYVSTAYSNVKNNNYIIDEKIYNTLPDLETVLYALDNCSDNDRLVKALLDGRPNTYTFSKALTEQLIEDQFNDLPITIMRPAISSIKEPIPGWTQGISASSKLIVVQGRRELLTWWGKEDMVVDLVPVDYVANAIIAAAWETYTNRIKGDKDIKVYTYSSGVQNPITFGDYMHTTSKSYWKHYNSTIPPFVFIITNYLLYSIVFFCLETVPAYINQGFNLLFTVNPLSIRKHKRKIKMTMNLKFFTLFEFVFIDKNVRKLYEAMEDEDQATFDFDIKKVKWAEYLDSYVMGLKKYVLKD